MSLITTTTAFGETIDVVYQTVTPPVAGENYWCDRQRFYLAIAGVAKYLVTTTPPCIYIEVDPELAEPDAVNTWLYGTVFAYILQARGYLVLHGSAVVNGEQAVVFSGDSGAGKSSLATALVHRGYPLLTDDVVALKSDANGVLWLVPGPARVKLWQDALTFFNTETTNLRRVINKQNKFELPLSSSIAALPVGQLFELNSSSKQSTISCQPQTASAKLQTIINNTYRYAMLQPMGIMGQHLKQCTALASQINVYKLTRPQQGYWLAELATEVENQLHH